MDVEYHHQERKSFRAKRLCSAGCNIIHLLQLLWKQLGSWQHFVDKDPFPPWHQIIVVWTKSSGSSHREAARLHVHGVRFRAHNRSPVQHRKARCPSFHLAASNLWELIKKALAVGLTQPPTYTKFFPKFKVEKSGLMPPRTHHRGTVPLPRYQGRHVSEQCVRGQRLRTWAHI